MEHQIHRLSTTDHKPPTSPVVSALHTAETEHRGRSSTNTSLHSSVQSYSPDKTERRKPSSTTNPFLHSPHNRKASNSVSPRMEAFTDHGKRGAQTEVLPTYRMGPQSDRKFRPHAVKKIMDQAFEESLDGIKNYDSVKCRALTMQVCEDIKQRVKWLNYERCKLICLVHIGSLSGQGMQVASQCLWDQNVDNFASTTYRNGDIFAVALLFGVYKE